MEVEELRVGNYINLQHKPVKVGIATLERIAYNAPMFIDQYTPIPLTEEWLTKFGFEKIGGTMCIHNGDFGIDFIQGRIYLDVENQNLALYNIKHVHQLQNLYFALTGSELVLKSIVPEAI